MSSSKWISFLLGCAIIHVWGGGPIGSYRVQKFDNVQCLLQFFQQCHCQKSNNFFSSTISVMPLLQINCNNFFISYFDNAIVTNFFFVLFRQCHCHKPIAINFFPFYFGNAIATNQLPLFFFRNDMYTSFLQYFYNKF